MTVDFMQTSDAPVAMDAAHTSAPAPCRKRKDMDESIEDVSSQTDIRRSTLKGLRQFAHSSADGDQQAHFHPLPHDLNLQLLANLGYMQPSQPSAMPHDISTRSAVSHSPTSSFSDFGGPSTPSDLAGSAVESYFSKGMRESSACYPTFDIYPGNDNRARSPGLLGMHMPPPSVGSADANGMQMDGMNDVVPAAAPPVHGSHCKSIPQLHVRSEAGVSSELWAFCPDCGTRSKVEAAPNNESLCYSP